MYFRRWFRITLKDSCMWYCKNMQLWGVIGERLLFGCHVIIARLKVYWATPGSLYVSLRRSILAWGPQATFTRSFLLYDCTCRIANTIFPFFHTISLLKFKLIDYDRFSNFHSLIVDSSQLFANFTVINLPCCTLLKSLISGKHFYGIGHIELFDLLFSSWIYWIKHYTWTWMYLSASLNLYRILVIM